MDELIEQENRRIEQMNDKQRLLAVEKKISELEMVIDGILTAVEVDLGLEPVKFVESDKGE